MFADCSSDFSTAHISRPQSDVEPKTAPSRLGFLRKIFNPSWNDFSSLLGDLGGLGNSKGLGEMGKPVRLPASLLADAKAKFYLNQFDVVVSDLISVNRTLPDHRNSE